MKKIEKPDEKSFSENTPGSHSFSKKDIGEEKGFDEVSCDETEFSERDVGEELDFDQRLCPWFEDSRTFISSVYPVVFKDSVATDIAEFIKAFVFTAPVGEIGVSASAIEILLEDTIINTEYDDWETEELDVAQAELIDIELEVQTINSEYDDWPTEEVNVVQAELLSIDMESLVVVYDDWPREEVDTSQAELISISLD